MKKNSNNCFYNGTTMFPSFYEMMYDQKPRRDEKFEDIKETNLKSLKKEAQSLKT